VKRIGCELRFDGFSSLIFSKKPLPDSNFQKELFMFMCHLIKILKTFTVLFALSVASAATVDKKTPLSADNTTLLERGKYMVVTGHCNNCHTDGYSANSGNIPESK